MLIIKLFAIKSTSAMVQILVLVLKTPHSYYKYHVAYITNNICKFRYFSRSHT